MSGSNATHPSQFLELFYRKRIMKKRLNTASIPIRTPSEEALSVCLGKVARLTNERGEGENIVGLFSFSLFTEMGRACELSARPPPPCRLPRNEC